MKNKFMIGISFLSLILFACAQEKNSFLADGQELPTKGPANPAAIKCIKEGYSLRPIEENGVAIGYLCINKQTGMKCEIWSYFRGECDLNP